MQRKTSRNLAEENSATQLLNNSQDMQDFVQQVRELNRSALSDSLLYINIDDNEVDKDMEKQKTKILENMIEEELAKLQDFQGDDEILYNEKMTSPEDFYKQLSNQSRSQPQAGLEDKIPSENLSYEDFLELQQRRQQRNLQIQQQRTEQMGNKTKQYFQQQHVTNMKRNMGEFGFQPLNESNEELFQSVIGKMKQSNTK